MICIVRPTEWLSPSIHTGRVVEVPEDATEAELTEIVAVVKRDVDTNGDDSEEYWWSYVGGVDEVEPDLIARRGESGWQVIIPGKGEQSSSRA